MTKEEFTTRYLSRLDEKQQQAVASIDGPVLVLAVPGSGKTTALVHRIGYMIYCENIAPENILTLTYTVAATQDMKNRFLSLFGEEFKDRLAFKTINGICATMLNYYGVKAGKSVYTLLDSEKDAPRVVSDILRAVQEDYPTEAEIKSMLSYIAYCKNMLFTDEEISKYSESLDAPLVEVFTRYQQYLREHNLMDYDDQLVYAYRLLKTKPDFLTNYRNRFRYICVDEAQDTSKVQHAIIRLLAGENGNLFMVGDEDQSIYGFRAAYPEALLNFSQDYPNAKIIVMNRNYRSNANIVAAAERLIRRNASRYDKKMEATKGGSSEVRVIDLNNRSNQYGYLVKVAQDCKRKTAVLYRDNECSLPLVDRLDRLGIPYQFRSRDLTFFSNRIVQDVSNIMRIAINPRDTESFMKVYYRGFLRIRKDEAQALCEYCASTGKSILDALTALDSPNPNVKRRSRSFVTNLRKMKTESPSKALFRIRNAMEYQNYLEQNGVGDGKLSILEMLAYSEFSLESFLRRLAYLHDMLENREQDPACLFVLSTIHSAKGLEFDQVYLMDVFDGCLPSKSITSGHGGALGKSGMEEERRLFYVGVTRAMYDLHLFRLADNTSTFLRELSAEPKRTQADKHVAAYYRKIPQVVNPYSASMEAANGNKITLADIVIGRIVYQVRYGRGIIVDMGRDDKNNLTFDVEFRNGKCKTFLFPVAFGTGNMRFED